MALIKISEKRERACARAPESKGSDEREYEEDRRDDGSAGVLRALSN